ncbi:MAG TPA: zinc metalloprotease HtpX [Candidatus Dormibacteraeota bacterium]|nr:zinc metalloprotease HtpX [Candidatus Dormibacteraeota bacterium]
MHRKLGADAGLTARMFLALFLLAVVYLAFVGVLLLLHISVALIVVVVAVLLVAQYFYSDKLVLSSLHANLVTARQQPELFDIVGRLCQITGMPMPQVAVINSPVPNALATGRNPKHSVVAVTTGILDQLEPKELEAVLAHELSHVIHKDVKVMAMASFFATVAALIVQSGMWFGMFGGFGMMGGGGYGGRGRGGGRDEGQGMIVIILVAAVVWAISFVLIRALSRYREYAADRGSAIITREPAQLASALQKISGTMTRIPSRDLRQVQSANALMIFPAVHMGKGSLAEMFSTHPSLDHRLAKLRELESQLSS